MKLTFLLTILTLLFSVDNLMAQVITTDENGERIIIYPDGSWKYFTAEDAKEIEAAKKQKRSEREVDEEELAKQREEEAERLAEEESRETAILLAEEALIKENTASEQLREATFYRKNAEENLEAAQLNPLTPVDDIILLKGELASKKKEEKAAEEAFKEAQKESKLFRKMIDMKRKKRDKLLAKLYGVDEQEKPEKAKEEIVEKKESKEKKAQFAKYNPKNDVSLFPPEQPCQIAYEGVDEFTSRQVKQVAPQHLFSFTNEKLKPFITDRDYILCKGSLTSLSGGVRILTLQFNIATEEASRVFGNLEKGSLLVLKMMNGSTVKLVNSSTSTGRFNPLDKTTTFEGSYKIGGSDEKTLKKNELDKIRVYWETGYEDYDVTELDFFANQFRCLDK